MQTIGLADGLLRLAILAGTLTGCGQKGPLVLPDAQHPHKQIGLPKSSTTPTSPPAAEQASPAAQPSPAAPVSPPTQTAPTAAPAPAPQI